MIPLHIHQTWKNNNIPEAWSNTPNQWKKLHPNCKYTLWTDEDNYNFIKNNFSWF